MASKLPRQNKLRTRELGVAKKSYSNEVWSGDTRKEVSVQINTANFSDRKTDYLRYEKEVAAIYAARCIRERLQGFQGWKQGAVFT